MANRHQNRIERLTGNLDLLILPALEWEPPHGYGIRQAVRAHSGDILEVDTGSVYPALHRLEPQKTIAADWRTSEYKQRVPVYRRTRRDKRQLLSERSRWEPIPDVIAGVLSPAGRESSS